MKAREEGNDVFSDVDEGNGDGDSVDCGIGVGVILFDFVKMNLSFKKEGRMIELKGISDEVKLLLMAVDMVSKNLTDKICIF